MLEAVTNRRMLCEFPGMVRADKVNYFMVLRVQLLFVFFRDGAQGVGSGWRRSRRGPRPRR